MSIRLDRNHLKCFLSNNLFGIVLVAFLVPVMSAVAADVQSATETARADSESGALEQIIVTATRRQENEQDVPISLTSFSRQTLDTRSVRQIDDLAALSPGL